MLILSSAVYNSDKEQFLRRYQTTLRKMYLLYINVNVHVLHEKPELRCRNREATLRNSVHCVCARCTPGYVGRANRRVQ